MKQYHENKAAYYVRAFNRSNPEPGKYNSVQELYQYLAQWHMAEAFKL